ncbi:MAG: site-specific DNA-methyltransferase [Myxococcota bacterium]
MARTPKTDAVETADFVHKGTTRKNNPPARIASEGRVPRVPKATYRYNPHLPPVLRFDSTGKADELDVLVDKAGKGALTAEEQRRLREALSVHQPWLEWANKQEQHDRGGFTVDPVVLHIHERLSTRAIIGAAMREDAQRKLFADPEQKYADAVKFYKHDVDWANRIILGDALQVMSSLAQRERLAGKVQMIYIDPPYGIKFGSNFQGTVSDKQVKDTSDNLSREAEVVKAYRDTWTLGAHTYLRYLTDRLLVCKEMLTESGSIFLQISDENLHRVRLLLDQVFGPRNFVAQILFRKTGGLKSKGLASVGDYLLWYAKDASKVRCKSVYKEKRPGTPGATQFKYLMPWQGVLKELSSQELLAASTDEVLSHDNLTSQGNAEYRIQFEGTEFKGTYKPSPVNLRRLIEAGRVMAMGRTLRYLRFLRDYKYFEINELWDDVSISGFGDEKLYVVQTLPEVVQRCMLMTTDPGDLVLDPTCGSGTTAYVAEQWGRRWITIDTSRVAVSIARQRVLTARFEHFRTKGHTPESGFVYKTVAHVKLGSIAQNTNLDPIFARHQPLLDAALTRANTSLKNVAPGLRRILADKLADKTAKEGKRAVTDADTRRWMLPKDAFEHWTVPFDTDPDWPESLQNAVTGYRGAWRARMDEVNACIERNADQEELVDQPEVVKGVVRVSGPFTVEGVRPEELSLGEDGLFDATPNEEEPEDSVLLAAERPPAPYGDEARDLGNLHAYLAQMVDHLRRDGVTFPNNKHRAFARVDPFNQSGSLVHAEGAWEGTDADQPSTVAIGFGPQCGPVTARQVEELIRASRRYDDLVIAGFSFEADASAYIKENPHPKLRIHQAHIRPDINPGMDGLLKNTPNSQLFTVFGTPEIKLSRDGDEWVCELEGVDIYDPVNNVVRSTKAEKVAAWFLDSDFDGRCFCVTQAFFPDQDAWEKIAKALKGSADPEAFAAFSGTTSVPFKAGRHKRVAVKVVDPRGNEVMAIRALGR